MADKLAMPKVARDARDEVFERGVEMPPAPPLFARHEWRDIKTPPRDGTRILVSRMPEDGYAHLRVGVDRWFRGQWWFSRREMRPTHWQPLPKPAD